MSVDRATHQAGSVQARLSHWKRFAGMLHRPRTVFEDLREHPSWLPPVVLATLASTLYGGVNYASVLLRSARDDPDPLLYLVRFVEELGFFALWYTAVPLLDALSYTLDVLALTGGSAVLSRSFRLGIRFRQVLSVVSYSLIWVVLARHLLSSIGIGVQWACDLESIPRAFGSPSAARLLDTLPTDSHVLAALASIDVLDPLYWGLSALGLSVVARSVSFRQAIAFTAVPAVIYGIAHAIAWNATMSHFLPDVPRI